MAAWKRRHIYKILQSSNISGHSIVFIVRGGKAMAKSLLRTDREIAEIYERHKSTVCRVCFAFMKNATDTEDAVQDTFFQLIKSGTAFESEEHEKAWLIRTASNLCKNTLRNWWRKRESLEDHNLRAGEDIEIDHVFSVVAGLPDKYKAVVYLYYYEGYNSAEISDILKKPPSTIRYYLHEARKILREKLGGDFNEE
jgi:RNA polymerase sigma-70 factor (ECF subfamily)